MKIIFLILLLWFLTACTTQTVENTNSATKQMPSPSPKPSPSPLANDPTAEEYYLQYADNPDDRIAVRKAVAEFTKNQEVKGTNVIALTGNVYLVGVDTGRRPLNLVVRAFMDKDGKLYWKAELLTPPLSNILRLNQNQACNCT